MSLFKFFSKKLYDPTFNINKSSIFDDCIRFLNSSSHSLQFKPFVKKSYASGGGNGLFMSGPISKYRVVSLYPGCYEPPPPTLAVLSSDGVPCVRPEELSLLPSSSYRIHCNNCGGYLDADKSLRQVDLKVPFSSYLLGHMINHPPNGIKPNVVPFDFYWDDLISYLKLNSSRNNEVGVDIDRLLSSVNPIAEGVWYVDPVTFSPVLRSPTCSPRVGMAIVSLRDLMDCEELWMDYKFHPEEAPPWYSSADKD